MLARGERTRLETSVLFTDRGITEIKKDLILLLYLLGFLVLPKKETK